MRKIKCRLFWSYDVLKTQEWLDELRKKELQLVKINSFFRMFYFVECEPKEVKHKIIYNKNTNGCPMNVKNSSDYNEICYTKNFYVLEQVSDDPNFNPTYNMLLARNHKIKYVVGNILTVLLFFIGMTLFSIIMLFVFSNGIDVEVIDETPTSPTAFDYLLMVRVLLQYLFVVLSIVWMIYTYFKLRVSNKKLEYICGENIDLSFTIPKDKILSNEELKQLRNDNKLIKRTRFAWFYSPDKTEEWLEEMESKGFNLLRMSKIGNSFYFVIGEKRNVKYHVDYQKRKGANYFSMNEESGWDLYFTSLSRFMAISVWGQEYNETRPKFYSDQESQVKHAKSFMMTYLIMYLPGIIVVSLSVGMMVSTWIESTNLPGLISVPFLFASTMMTILLIEYLWFVFRLIRYYTRVKAKGEGEVV